MSKNTDKTPAESQPQTGSRREHAAGLMDSLLLIGARVGANVLTLIWTVLLVRLVQPELSGIAFRAIAIAQIISIPLTLNVESGAMRTLVPAMHTGRLDEAAGFIKFNRRMIVFSLPLLIASALIWNATFATQSAGWLTIWIAAGSVLVAMARLTGRHAAALGVMRKGLLPRLLMGPVVLTVGLGSAWLAGLALHPWHVAALFALSEALTVLTQSYLLRTTFAQFRGQPAPTTGWRDWITLGLWLTPGLMMTEYRKALLIATAGLALSAAQLSLFAVAFSIINIINFGVVAVDVAFGPRIANAMAADAPVRRDRLLAVSGVIKIAGLTLGVLLTVALGNWALGWFGAEYQDAWPVLLILLMLPTASILFGPASAILSARGFGRADFTGNVLGALATVAAVYLGGATAGLTGAAIGAVIGQVVSLAFMTVFCRRNLAIDPSLISLRHLRPAPGAHEAAT